jgi:hypothetical protein
LGNVFALADLARTGGLQGTKTFVRKMCVGRYLSKNRRRLKNLTKRFTDDFSSMTKILHDFIIEVTQLKLNLLKNNLVFLFDKRG